MLIVLLKLLSSQSVHTTNKRSTTTNYFCLACPLRFCQSSSITTLERPQQPSLKMVEDDHTLVTVSLYSSSYNTLIHDTSMSDLGTNLFILCFEMRYFSLCLCSESERVFIFSLALPHSDFLFVTVFGHPELRISHIAHFSQSICFAW